MARKWGLFFHRLFTVLRLPPRLRCAVYVGLGLLSLLGCLLAAPGVARLPIANTTYIANPDETAIAQTSPTPIPEAASAEQFPVIPKLVSATVRGLQRGRLSS